MTTFDISADQGHQISEEDLHTLQAQLEPAPANPVAAIEQPEVELILVDPNDLIIGANVRFDPQLDAAFVADIKERGVREAITVRPDADGNLVVHKGKRRTLASIQAGRTQIRALLERVAIEDATEREVERIVDQLAENHHRRGNTAAEDVHAVQELLNLGLTAGQIGKKTRRKAKDIKAMLPVAQSELAAKAMARFHLTLEHAAAIAEAEADGDAEGVKVLAVTAKTKPEQFEHVAQRLRDARALERLRHKALADLTQAGVTVIKEPEIFGKVSLLRNLCASADSTPVKFIEPAEHAECPGHAAWLEDRGRYHGDARFRPVYVCTDWQAHGHAERFSVATRHATSGTAAAAATGGGKMTEEQKTERRITIQNNRDMESATVVRRKWIQENLLGPKPPKDTTRWIGTVIASGSNDLRKAMETGHMLACELLGVAAEIKDCNRWSGKTHPLETELAGASGPRATKLTLGMVAGAAEEAIDKTAWRYATNDTKTWLSKLEEWGYPLSDVERLVITPAGPATTPEETDVESVDVVDPHQVEHHEPVDGEALDQHWATVDADGEPADSVNETRIGGGTRQGHHVG